MIIPIFLDYFILKIELGIVGRNAGSDYLNITMLLVLYNYLFSLQKILSQSFQTLKFFYQTITKL